MKRLFVGCFALLFIVVIAVQARGATNVPAGFDLLTTQPGAFFDLDGPGGFPAVDMTGVPLGTYDFGSGPEPVNTTDTIVERLNPAFGPGIDTIPIEMVSLQLVSAVPVPLAPLGGAGVDFIAATLSSDRGRHGSDPPPGLPSSGSMSIDFGANSFTSSIGLVFDLRAGGVSGPILPLGVGVIKMIHNTTPIPWASTFNAQSILVPQLEVSNPLGFTEHPFIATPDFLAGSQGPPLIIPGVNEDFIVGVAVVPDPVPAMSNSASLALLFLLGLGGVMVRRAAVVVERVRPGPSLNS